MGWTASAAPIVGVSLAALLLIGAAGWIARRVPHTAVQGTEPLAR